MPRAPRAFTAQEVELFDAVLRGKVTLYAAALRLGRVLHVVAYRFSIFAIRRFQGLTDDQKQQLKPRDSGDPPDTEKSGPPRAAPNCPASPAGEPVKVEAGGTTLTGETPGGTSTPSVH